MNNMNNQQNMDQGNIAQDTQANGMNNANIQQNQMLNNPYINNNQMGNNTMQQNQMQINPYINNNTNNMQNQQNDSFINGDFVKGALIGAGVAFLLTNKTTQTALMDGFSKGNELVQAGIEELKERIEDAKAQMGEKDA